MFFLPESPKYLINKNQTEKARKSLHTIARFNKRPNCDFSETVFKVETVSKEDLRDSVKEKSEDEIRRITETDVEYEGKVNELCKYKSLRINMIVITCVNFISVLSVYQV